MTDEHKNLLYECLSHYLSYGLQIQIEKDGKVCQDILIGLTGEPRANNEDYVIGLEGNYKLEDVMPILRPLSDLIKEIEIDGEWFVPAKHLFYDYRDSLEVCWSLNDQNELEEIWLDYPETYGDYAQESRFTLQTIQLLYEWHFDIHGLIPKGVALDMNTLDT